MSEDDYINRFVHDKVVNELEAENARLKADIKDLREDRIRMCDVTIEDIAVIARLKAEVERLTEDNRQLTKAFEIAEGIIKRMGKAAEDAAKDGKPSV